MINKTELIDGKSVVGDDGTLCGIKTFDQSYAELVPRQEI
jgi:hypothetical protein